jgi:2-keto-4-pentenoate hydratase
MSAMKKNSADYISDKLINAFLNNKIISPIPTKFSKKLENANKFRRLCESKINEQVIGFKVGGTALPMMKKFKEKEPFYASIYKRNFLKSGKKVIINKATFGIELEVCFIIKKNFFNLKSVITKKNISRFISHIAPCIEIVGYRQRKKGIKSFGDLSSDFGANFKFLIGKKKKFKNINVKNLKTNLLNTKINHSVKGNTNTVLNTPLNSLKFALNKIKKDKINLNKNFYVFTGSTIGVVPILSTGLYTGKIEKLGSVKVFIKK